MTTNRRSTTLTLPAALAALIALPGLPAAASAQNPPCYEVTATFTGPNCPGGDAASPSPYAVNDDGCIAGSYTCTLGWPQAFLWSGQGQAGPIPMPPGTYLSRAHDVNSAGWTVGYREGGGHWAFLYDGVETMLIPPPNNSLSEAMAINDDGWIVGFWRQDNGISVTFKWRDGEFTDLHPLIGGLTSRAEDINNADPPQITGWRGLDGQGTPSAYILQGEQLIDLGPIAGGFGSWGRAINDLGEVVGKGNVPHPDPPGWKSHAFYWSDGVMTDLGTLPEYPQSIANDINDAGQIVGTCERSGVEPLAPFLWQNGQMWNLNDLVMPGTGITLESARAINDSGEIVLRGDDAAGHAIAVVLRPIIADLNGDCVVDHDDLLILLGQWSCANSPADFNNDGTVNVLDLLFLLAQWTV